MRHGRAGQAMAGHDMALQGMQGVAHTAGSYHSYESSFGKISGLNVGAANFPVVLDFRFFRHFRQVVFSMVHKLSNFFKKLTTIFRLPCIAGLAR